MDQQNEGEMMDDRELLEMAAKAAGIEVGHGKNAQARFIGDHPQLWFHNDARNHPMCRKPNRAGNVPWNPLADDGDALRLAVKLDIWIHPGEGPEVVEVVVVTSMRFAGYVDRNAATRRAIVRAAAAIAATLQTPKD